MWFYPIQTIPCSKDLLADAAHAMPLIISASSNDEE